MDIQPLVTSFLAKAESPLIVIVGPTASGKTGLSTSLAMQLEGRAEIINADSRQLYRGMNIGTAKITPDEMKGIPHHLLDVLEPTEELTVAWYQKQALRTIQDIHTRGHVPILVGGSMLYIASVIDGLSLAPKSDPSIRSAIEQEYDVDGGAALYQELVESDPETAHAFHQNNKPYVVRAIELLRHVGLPSSLKTKQGSPFDLLILGMEWEREALRQRILGRTKHMFGDGFVAEVQSLLEKGIPTSAPAFKSVGYPEIAAALQTGNLDEEQLIEEIAQKSAQYAKRQMTWWKKDSRIHWIAGSSF